MHSGPFAATTLQITWPGSLLTYLDALRQREHGQLPGATSCSPLCTLPMALIWKEGMNPFFAGNVDIPGIPSPQRGLRRPVFQYADVKL